MVSCHPVAVEVTKASREVKVREIMKCCSKYTGYLERLLVYELLIRPFRWRVLLVGPISLQRALLELESFARVLGLISRSLH